MTHPNLEEITAYCDEKHPKVDAMGFFLHYEMNGWMVGRVPMKNWHAAVANWERQQHRFGGQNVSKRDEEFQRALERSREADREDESLLRFPSRSGAGVPQSLRPHDRGIRHSSGQLRFNEGD